jgi:DNA-binding IclR family transcriptional regulator
VGGPQAELPRTPESQGGVQVIARVGQVLRALDGEALGLSLAQLADRVGLPRSTVHRIVTALVAEGLVANASPAGSMDSRMARTPRTWIGRHANRQRQIIRREFAAQGYPLPD